MKKKRKIEAKSAILPRRTGKLLGVGINSISKCRLLELTSKTVKTRGKISITTLNPEIIVEATRDQKLLEAINGSDVAVPDGIGLLWALKIQSHQNYQRIPGRILMTGFFDLAGKEGLKVYLLGASGQANEKALEKAQREYPNASFVGDSGGIVTKSGITRRKDIVDKINKFAPDFLFVAFGAPKQEKWIARNSQMLNAHVIMTVGGSLDYYSGLRPLPARFISKVGLEWMWRLFTKPRHAKRVFRATVIFPVLVVKDLLGL